MKKTLNHDEFNKEFNEWTHNNYNHNVTNALLDFYNDFDENMEFDPIAINCDWTLYANFDEIKENYSDTYGLDTLDDLDDFTQYIDLKDDGILVLAF